MLADDLCLRWPEIDDYWRSVSSITSICGGFVVQQVVEQSRNKKKGVQQNYNILTCRRTCDQHNRRLFC